MDKNGKTQWHRKFPGETRLGFKGQYKHTQSVHIIGGISRREATKLMIFTGSFCICLIICNDEEEADAAASSF